MRNAQTASRSPVAAILLGGALLEDFISEQDFVNAMLAARWRVIRVFANAGSPDRRRRGGRNCSTRGFIADAGNTLNDLAKYLMHQMGPRVLDKIYSADDLPAPYHTESKRDRDHIARYVCYELIMRQLILLRDANTLWYQEGWLLPQSVLDEYLRIIKSTKQSYRDQRSFHGRPTRDRSRLRGIGYAPGVSVGASR